jgi:hypothetical protein
MTVTCYATFSLTEVPFWDSLTTVYFVVLVSILLGVLRRSQLKREQAGR